MAEEVNRIEVCSMGEFRICKQKEIPAEKLLISGVMKDQDDIVGDLETYGNRCHYTIESLNQYAILNEWARSSGKKVPVYLRLTSGNQFGMDEETLTNIVELEQDKRSFGDAVASTIFRDTEEAEKDLGGIDISG